MRTRAVIFDLDGTLVDSERQYGEAMARALVTVGISVRQADRDYVIGHSWVAIHEWLCRQYPQLGWTRDELIARTAAASYSVFDEQGVKVLPGACDAVRRFADRARGMVTGSSRAEAGAMIQRLGLEQAFGVVLCAEDVARSKPAPDGYLAACAHLQVQPAEVVVIEDSTAGIAAGRAAGCGVIAVRAGNFSGQDQTGAHRVVATLDEVTRQLVDEVASAVATGYGGPADR